MINQEQLERLKKVIELSEGNKDIINLINEIIALDINEKKAKDSKFNIYDFVSKDKNPYRECLCGVYHDRGWRVASNSHTLIAIKEEYDKKYEGKILREDNSEIVISGRFSESYPKWESVKQSYKKKASFKIDFDRLAEWMRLYKSHHKTMSVKEKKCHTEYVKVRDSYYSLTMFNTFASGMKYLGTDKIIQCTEEKGYREPAFAETERGWAAIMPIMSPDKYIQPVTGNVYVYEF